MKRYEVVLLDADQTLLDFRRSEADALQAAFEQNGLPADGEFLAAYHRINDGLWARDNRGEIAQREITDTRFVRLFSAFGIDLDGRAFNDVYLDHLSRFAYTMPGAIEFCRTLREMGVRQYVATNGIARVQKSRYKRSGLDAYMQGIFVSEEVGAGKPDKLFFDRVLHEAGDPPRKKVLMVGDSRAADIAGGVRAGIDTCWIDPDGTAENGAETYRVRSLAQLRTIFLTEAGYGTDITANP